MQARYQIKHVHYADMQNALAPAAINVAVAGNHGVIYAVQIQNTAAGRPLHPHAVAPKDCVKTNKKHPFGCFFKISTFIIQSKSMRVLHQ